MYSSSDTVGSFDGGGFGATGGSTEVGVWSGSSARSADELLVRLAASGGPSYAQSGRTPNEQHAAGVRLAIADYISKGWEIIEPGPVAVDVPGFSTPRFYDFVVRDRVSNQILGVEVKTTMTGTLRFDRAQVAKDVVVMSD